MPNPPVCAPRGRFRPARKTLPLPRCRILLAASLWLCGLAGASAETGAEEGSRLGARPEQPSASAASVQQRIHVLESQLSEVSAEKAALARQLDSMHRKQKELQTQAAEVPALRRALRESESAIERAEQDAAQLREEIEQLQKQRQTAAQDHTAQLNAAELRVREHKDRLGGVEERIQNLEQLLAQREAQIELLDEAEARRAHTQARIDARLSQLRPEPPTRPAGTSSAAEARAQAQQDAELLTRLVSEGQGIQNPQLWQRVREAENALHRHQFELAQAEGARTVYRVRPGDSLDRVSMMVYGNDTEWSRIFEANRHLLEDPQRVLPGLTLVIP